MSAILNHEYEDLLAKILCDGVQKEDRTGTGTRSLFGHQLRYDLSQGFPLITTKQVFLRGVVVELLWLLSGSTNIKPLVDQDVHIWDAWADQNGELGPVYGAQWRAWPDGDGGSIDQISRALDQIKSNPDSRRIIVNAWNIAMLDKMALPPCHAFFQFYVANNRLSCKLYQRSADMFLGVPFNIASYSLLTHMMAQQAGLEVGEFIWSGGDCHVYSNHVNQVEEQLSRSVRSFPTLHLTHRPSLFDYRVEDVRISGYDPHPPIKGKVAV